MNIKINIKDCECGPTVITKKQISEVEHKKKNMLYAPPTKDNKRSVAQSRNIPSSTEKKAPLQQTHSLQREQYSPMINQEFHEQEKKLVNDLKEISRQYNAQDQNQQTTTILQRQNQMIEQNQRTLHSMVMNGQGRENQMREREARRAFEQAADRIAREMKDIKKIRDEIVQAVEGIKRSASEGKNMGNTGNSKAPQQIGEMNSNLKNLVQMSKNHIQGLENLQGIKSLQNFNVQAYTQSINTLKKQIVQYQKQSQNIERQLKLRVAKLQKLQISPNFEQQLLQPYETYLKKKAESIDLHTIKDKVYEKLGVFDYGKFQLDVGAIMNEVKSEMNDFYIVCKQYRIEVPDVRIDKKQLKQLELKLPSVLDQYKASKGIVFAQRGEQGQEKLPLDTKSAKMLKSTSREKPALEQKKQFSRTGGQKQLPELGPIYTKPVDYSTSTKLTRVQPKEQRSVLQTKQEQQKRQVTKQIKKQKGSQSEDFQKYLENRAKQELAAIYEQKTKKLKQMENQLYKKCQEEPEYQLTMNVKGKVESKKETERQSEKKKIAEEKEEQYEEDFEDSTDKRKNKPKQSRQKSHQKEQIKAIGTQVLREKLKNLFSKNPALGEHAHQNKFINEGREFSGVPLAQQGIQNGQMASLAQGFISMINNTLTQVNTHLSQSIQKKIQNRSFSQQKRPTFQKASPAKIVIPKLEQFLPPPVFNMQLVQEPVYRPQQKRPQKKIVKKDYRQLRVEYNENEFEISSMSNDEY